MRILILLMILAILLLSGCQEPLYTSDQIVIKQYAEMPNIINWNNFPKEYAEYWLKEAKTRFKNPVIVMCHGNTMSLNNTKIWYAFPGGIGRERQSVNSLAATLKNLYPDNEIVLIICNPDGISLNDDLQNVYYSKSNVWTIPDSENPLHETIKNFYYVGSISEFYPLPAGGSPTTQYVSPSLHGSK